MLDVASFFLFERVSFVETYIFEETMVAINVTFYCTWLAFCGLVSSYKYVVYTSLFQLS